MAINKAPSAVYGDVCGSDSPFESTPSAEFSRTLICSQRVLRTWESPVNLGSARALDSSSRVSARGSAAPAAFLGRGRRRFSFTGVRAQRRRSRAALKALIKLGLRLRS